MKKQLPIFVLIVSLILSVSSASLIQESSASSTVDLDINSYDPFINQWVLVGADPYLDTLGGGDYIGAIADNRDIFRFKFQKLPFCGMEIESVTLYMFANPTGETLRANIHNTYSWSAYDVTGAVPQYYTADVTAHLDNVCKINGADLWLKSVAIGAWTGTMVVDHVFLRVVYNLPEAPLLTSGQDQATPMKSKSPLYTVLSMSIFCGVVGCIGLYKKYN